MATIKQNPVVIFLAREQKFRFSLSGLQPLTRHYMYFERRLVDNAKIKPVGKKLGEALFTDSNGKVAFDFYYDSGLTATATPLLEAQRIANLIAGNKEVVVTTTYASSLATNYKDSALSYYESHILVQTYIPPESEFTEVKK